MFHVQYVSMSNLILSISSAPCLAEPILAEQQIGRPDSLTSQHVEVGLVLNAMLGASAAADYLARRKVDPKIAERVLSKSGRRRGTHDASGLPT